MSNILRRQSVIDELSTLNEEHQYPRVSQQYLTFKEVLCYFF